MTFKVLLIRNDPEYIISFFVNSFFQNMNGINSPYFSSLTRSKICLLATIALSMSLTVKGRELENINPDDIVKKVCKMALLKIKDTNDINIEDKDLGNDGVDRYSR